MTAMPSVPAGRTLRLVMSYLMLSAVMASALAGCSTASNSGSTLPQTVYEPPKNGPLKGQQVGGMGGKKVQ